MYFQPKNLKSEKITHDLIFDYSYRYTLLQLPEDKVSVQSTWGYITLWHVHNLSDHYFYTVILRHRSDRHIAIHYRILYYNIGGLTGKYVVIAKWDIQIDRIVVLWPIICKKFSMNLFLLHNLRLRCLIKHCNY